MASIDENIDTIKSIIEAQTVKNGEENLGKMILAGVDLLSGLLKNIETIAANSKKPERKPRQPKPM